MIDHTGINVSNLAASKAFYLAALTALEYVARKEATDIVIFGSRLRTEGEDPAGDFYIWTGEVLSPRSHIAFRAKTRAQVDAFYRDALAAGGRSNGAPGLRPKYHAHYYAAFVLDPDGYNVEAVCHIGAPGPHCRQKRAGQRRDPGPRIPSPAWHDAGGVSGAVRIPAEAGKSCSGDRSMTCARVRQSSCLSSGR